MGQSEPVTLDEVWRLFKETDLEIKETGRQVLETSRQMKESDRQWQETRRQMKESDRQWQETRHELAEIHRRVDDSLRRVDALAGKWGRFVESVIAPACETLFAKRGIAVHAVSQRVRVRREGRSFEVDILVLNQDYAVLVEVKSTLKVQDIRDHLVRLEQFKFFFPEYAGRQVLGAVAGMTVDEGADLFAYREGLFVLAQSGESVRLANDDAFQPRIW